MKILISLFLLSNFTFASARVCKKDGALEVYSNLIFYGEKASEHGADCAQEIYSMFNAPNAKIKINGEEFPVKFKVSYQIENEKDVYASVNINKRVENNYIRIEDKTTNIEWNRSNHTLSGNCGFYTTGDKLGHSTTCTHEFAHGLGLTHYTDRGSGYGSDGNLIGKGAPGIMAARGFFVDRKYQYNKKASPGTKGGTINPIHRVVRQEDVEDLGLEFLSFDEDGCADLGSNLGMAYTKEGDIVTGKNWYAFDALNYIVNDFTGNLSKPTQCGEK